MSRKRLPYAEGTWFAVPLRDRPEYGVGLVVRLNEKGGVLGYFFGQKFKALPTLSVLSHLGPDDAVLVRQFGDLGLIKRMWPILGKHDRWVRDEWHVPPFARIAVDQSAAWQVRYSDDDGMTVLGEHEIPVSEATFLPEDGLSGYGAIELRLTKLLESK